MLVIDLQQHTYQGPWMTRPFNPNNKRVLLPSHGFPWSSHLLHHYGGHVDGLDLQATAASPSGQSGPMPALHGTFS